MFLIILPRGKPAPKRIGFVADYCPVCVDARRLVLFGHGTGERLFFVTINRRDDAHYEKCCTECGVELAADITHYSGTWKKNTGIEDLILRTQPDLRRKFEHELQIGSGLRSGKLVPDRQQKADCMLHVMECFNPMVQRRYANWSTFDRYSSTGCLGTLALFVYFFSQGFGGGNDGSAWLKAAFITIAIGTVITLVIAAFNPARYMRSRILPGLVKGIKVFNPTEDELRSLLQRAESLGLKIGRKVRLEPLKKALEDMPRVAGLP